MMRLLICMAFLPTVLSDWAASQEVAPALTNNEKQQALQEIKGQRQYGVYLPGCRLSNVELGTYKSLGEAVVAAQASHRTGSTDAFVVVGEQSRIYQPNDAVKVKVYMVGASLRCSTPYVAAKYSSATEARAAAKDHPHEVMVLDVGDKTAEAKLSK